MIRFAAFLATLFWGSAAFGQATVVTACGGGSFIPGTVIQSLVDVNGVACSGPGGMVRVVTSCGSMAPFGPTPPGSQAYSTVDTTGKGCGLGSGATCTQATAYLARATGETAHAADLTTLICGLVTDGVWAKLDALYVLAQQNETDAKLNLLGTSYGLTQAGTIRLRPTPAPNIGTIVFTPYVGFSGFSSLNSFLDTGFNPSTAGSPMFTQNSASFGEWIYDSTIVDGSGSMGNGNTGNTGESNMYVHFTDGGFYARVNFPTSGSVPNPASKGLYVGDRSSSANVVPYVNGAAQATQAGVSQPPLGVTFAVGKGGASGTLQTISAAFIGASLGAAGNLALYNRLRTYMTAVGVP